LYFPSEQWKCVVEVGYFENMWVKGNHCNFTEKTTPRPAPHRHCLHRDLYKPSYHTYQRKDRHLKNPRRRLTLAASFQINNKDFATPDITEEEAPKFRPFIAQDEILNRVKRFKYTKPTPYGQVVVVPLLSEQFIDPAANILTESFADAMGASPYRNYLRKQIRKYLHHHIIRLAPKSVVLAALLLEEEEEITDDNGVDVHGSSTDNYNNDNNAALSLETNKWINEAKDTPVEHDSDDHTNSTSISTKEPSPSSLQNAKVLGVVELSFSETTRSKYLTLNSPTDRSYLCNMAILSEQRKKGFGKILLDAGEQLAVVLGEREVWLHLRLKDDKTAGRLYRGAGYKVVKEDPFLLVFLNMDRRYLMRKRI
jgi:ribosomal protein S18 acetylase RimI-like enzyme